MTPPVDAPFPPTIKVSLSDGLDALDVNTDDADFAVFLDTVFGNGLDEGGLRMDSVREEEDDSFLPMSRKD